MAKVLLFVLFAEIWTAVGHILFKKGADSLESPRFESLSCCWDFVRNVLRIRKIWLGLASMGIGLVAWLMALS